MTEKGEYIVIEPGIKFRIENIVGSLILGIRLSLPDLYKELLKIQAELQRIYADELGSGGEEFPLIARHSPQEFPGLILKMRFPDVKASMLVFSSGNCVITGTRSEKQLKKAVQRFVDILKRCGYELPKEPELKIQNIVASADIGKKLNLDLIALSGGYNVIYEPEIFPGCIYRDEELKVVLLLFRSGKIVCTGAKSLDHVKQVLQKLYDWLVEIDGFLPEEA
ncbi:MAG: TATA-box-binding protein [Candidatus Njordarchaeota archaeon]